MGRVLQSPGAAVICCGTAARETVLLHTNVALMSTSRQPNVLDFFLVISQVGWQVSSTLLLTQNERHE